MIAGKFLEILQVGSLGEPSVPPESRWAERSSPSGLEESWAYARRRLGRLKAS